MPMDMLSDNEDMLETAGEMLRNARFHPVHDEAVGRVSESSQAAA